MRDNTYYRLHTPARLDVETGAVRGTNVYYGSSQVLENVLETIDAKAGDEIHRLVGGDFFVPLDGGEVRTIHMVTYAPYVGATDRLGPMLVEISTVISPADRTDVASYRTRESRRVD